MRNEQTNGEAGSATIAAVAPKSPSMFTLRNATIAAVVIVAASGVSWFILNREPAPTYTTIPSEQQFFDKRLNELLASPPKSAASTTSKAGYYADLTHTYADLKKYPEAIESFKKWEAQADGDITYFDYLDLAKFYHETGDKTGAVAAVDEALSIMPEDDPSTGYNKAEYTVSIQELRQEYAR